MKVRRIVGWLLVGLIGAILVLAGSANLFGFAPQEIVTGLRKAGLEEEIRLIGAGGIVTGVLLLTPRTFSLGVLLASTYWGGAICTHMARGDSYAAPVILLLVTWLGAFMRDGRVMASFRGPSPSSPDSPPEK